MDADALYDSSDKIFEVDREILTFTPIQSKEYEKESSLIITNISNYHIAFRVKTTRKEDYTVIPNHIVISPREKTQIDFKLIRKKLTGSLSDHKFKLCGFIISNADKDKDAKQLFYQLEKTKTRVKGNVVRMKVDFDGNTPLSPFHDITQSQNVLYHSINMPETDLDLNSKIKDNSNRKTQQLKEELENLKVEYFKLKNQFGTLSEKEEILNKRIRLENAPESANLKPFNMIPTEEKKVSSIVSMGLCIATIILGFYLTN